MLDFLARYLSEGIVVLLWLTALFTTFVLANYFLRYVEARDHQWPFFSTDQIIAPKKGRNLLCRLGFHVWQYHGKIIRVETPPWMDYDCTYHGTKRICARCGRRERATIAYEDQEGGIYGLEWAPEVLAAPEEGNK